MSTYHLLQIRPKSGASEVLATGDMQTAKRMLLSYRDHYITTFWKQADRDELTCTLKRKNHILQLVIEDANQS